MTNNENNEFARFVRDYIKGHLEDLEMRAWPSNSNENLYGKEKLKKYNDKGVDDMNKNKTITDVLSIIKQKEVYVSECGTIRVTCDEKGCISIDNPKNKNIATATYKLELVEFKLFSEELTLLLNNTPAAKFKVKFNENIISSKLSKFKNYSFYSYQAITVSDLLGSLYMITKGDRNAFNVLVDAITLERVMTPPADTIIFR